MSKLYILNNKKGLVKIGITDDDVKKRVANINKSISFAFGSIILCTFGSFEDLIHIFYVL